MITLVCCNHSAVGPLDSSGALAQHPGDGYSPGSINYATGALQLTTSASPEHSLQVRVAAFISFAPLGAGNLPESVLQQAA